MILNQIIKLHFSLNANGEQWDIVTKVFLPLFSIQIIFSTVFRGFPDPIFLDPGVCWDTSLFPGNVSGTVHISGRPRSVEAHAHDER